MNLLYLAHKIPFPRNKGDKIRVMHIIWSLILCGMGNRVLKLLNRVGIGLVEPNCSAKTV